MCLIYFLPGFTKQALQPEEARKIGIGHAVEDGSGLSCVQTKKGPDGKSGLLAAPAGYKGKLRHDAKDQTWRKAPGGAYWVGRANDQAIGPTELARKERFDGELVELADGNKWLIPRLVGFLEGRPSSLPRRFDLDDDGEPLVRIHEKYQDIADRAWTLWLTATGQLGDQPELTYKEELQLATDALALNYRISHIEAVGLLRLLDTRSLTKVLRSLIDFEAIDEAVKRGKVGRGDDQASDAAGSK